MIPMSYLERKLTHEQFTRVIMRPVDRIMIITPGLGFMIYEEPRGEPIPIKVSMTCGPKVVRVFESLDGYHLINFTERPVISNFWVTDFQLRYRGMIGVFFSQLFIGGYYLFKNWLRRNECRQK